MASSISALNLTILLFSFSALVSASSLHVSSLQNERSRGRRLLLSFKEKPKGTNATFECSPSGPCVPCQYSEKNDEKYRCSETGYRIPMKCVMIEDGSKDANKKKSTNSRSDLEISQSEKPHVTLHDARQITSIKHRNLQDDSSTVEGGSQAYITYRSCIPAVNDEKLSVLGFEGTVLCLLFVGGSVVYFRKKQSVVPSGFTRIQTNSRF